MVWPFTETVDALNNLYSFLIGLPSVFGAIAAIISTIFLYPIVLLINLLYTNLNNLYSVAAGLINIIISIPNFVSASFGSWLPSGWPSVWSVLFLMSISIGVFIRSIRIAVFIRKWIPILWG